MEIQGAAFLYALAAAAMAFIGFSAIVVIIRQTLGAGLSPFQLLLTQVLIEHGFVVFFFSLLPLLLALFGISHESVWRISSGVAAAVISSWILYYYVRRYPAVRSKPHPLFAWINFAIASVAMLSLLGNAAGTFYQPQAGRLRCRNFVDFLSSRRRLHIVAQGLSQGI
jgi:hypothetical protein